MDPHAKVLFLLFSSFVVIAEGMPKTESASKNDTAPSKDKSVKKRQYGFQDTALWHHSNLALLNTGLLLSDFGLEHFPGEFHDLIRLQEGGYQGAQKTVHQLQDDVPTSPPRNPKKPIYHYTPLPPGTFPAPKPEDIAENEKSLANPSPSYIEGNIPNPNYIFGYLVNAGQNGGNYHRAYQTFPSHNRLQLVQYWPTPNIYHTYS